MKEKAILSWSGGKDSTLALHELTKRADYEIVTLLTTLSNDCDRTCMHGIRRVMLEQQAQSLGIALEKVFISKDSPNEEYESRIQEVLERHRNVGVRSVVFGDIFLEDLRKYRQEKLSKIGMKAVFPIWKFDTTKLANMFITSGFKAVITCVDSNVLGKAFVGRAFDERFLSELPTSVDSCGENGEFHSFVYDGPMFKNSVPYTIGEVELRERRFYFCDLVPFENIRTSEALPCNE